MRVCVWEGGVRGREDMIIDKQILDELSAHYSDSADD